MSCRLNSSRRRRSNNSCAGDGGADWTDAAGCAGDPLSALLAADLGEAGLLAFLLMLGAALIAGGVALFVAARRRPERCLLYSLAANAVLLFGAAALLGPLHHPQIAHEALLGGAVLSAATVAVWFFGRRTVR